MSKKEIRLRVPSEFHAKLEEAAEARGIPLTALVAVAVYDYVSMSKPKPRPTTSAEELKQIVAEWGD